MHTPHTPESLFRDYFWPLYPEDARADLARARARDANPGANPAVLAHLDEAAAVFVAMHARVFGKDLALDYSDASVHRLGAALTRERRDALARPSAGSPITELFNVVVHGTAYVGRCIVRSHDAEWEVRRPLWESPVRLRSRAGVAELAVFQWWLKALADDAYDDAGLPRHGLAERYRTYVEVPTVDPQELPVIADASRALPRLAKVRYDLLHKYFKAHLPEVKDLGVDFPSAERFDAYAFQWLDVRLVGDGRMVLVYGPGQGGLHAFWLDRGGFQKSVLFACDAFPEPVVELQDDRIRFVVSFEGKTVLHEVLWWGP